MTPYGDIGLVSIGSGNAVLPSITENKLQADSYKHTYLTNAIEFICLETGLFSTELISGVPFTVFCQA